MSTKKASSFAPFSIVDGFTTTHPVCASMSKRTMIGRNTPCRREPPKRKNAKLRSQSDSTGIREASNQNRGRSKNSMIRFRMSRAHRLGDNLFPRHRQSFIPPIAKACSLASRGSHSTFKSPKISKITLLIFPCNPFCQVSVNL